MENKWYSESYLDFLIHTKHIGRYDDGTNITPVNSEYAILHVPDVVAAQYSPGNGPFFAFPSVLTLTGACHLEEAAGGKLQTYPDLGLSGKGVLVALIDTGIDYCHEAFRNGDNTSRILSLWDQTLEGGEPSERVPFGTEYRQNEISAALAADDPARLVPTRDEVGHGTMLAGVIAGRNAKEFSSIAPDAELIVVKLKQAKGSLRRALGIPEQVRCFQETDVLLGIEYARKTAKNRPLVLCLALGMSQGGGKGEIGTYLDQLVQTAGVGAVVTAGAKGNRDRHLEGSMTGLETVREFALQVDAQDQAFALEIWVSAPGRLLLELVSPTGETIGPVYPKAGVSRRIPLIFSKTTVCTNSGVTESGDQRIWVRFEDPQVGIWSCRVHNLDRGDCTFHAWLLPGALSSGDTRFLHPSPDSTVTAPGNVVHPLTVTAYDADSHTTLPEAGSEGKPDLAAPGTGLACPVQGGGYGVMRGAGAAAAYASGMMALVFEWAVTRGHYPAITGDDVSQLLRRGTDRDAGVEYPNALWGYGKLDIQGVFRNLR